MAEPNRLKSLLDRGGVAVGLSCSTGNIHAVELMAHSEVDYIYLDQQHGLTSFDVLLAQLRAFAGTTTTPLVRVLRNDAALIGQALDAGAHGVIVPMVNTVEDAHAAVAGCRYQPAGVRSWGPLRARFGLGTDPLQVNAEVLCFVMVETLEGIDNVEAIADVSGVDGIYIGPADLAVSMGLAPGLAIQAGAHAAAIARIVSACVATGKVAAMSGDPSHLADQGLRMITAGGDAAFLQSGLNSVIQARHELSAGHSSGSA